MSKDVIDRYNWIIANTSRFEGIECIQNVKWLKGMALIRNKNYKKALECFKELVELEHPNAYILFQFIQYKLTGNVAAISFLDQVEYSLKQSKDFQYIKGFELFLLGKPEEAIAYYYKAESLGINSNTFYLDKGYVLMDLMRIEEALELYNKILARDSYNLTAIYYKAFLLHLLHKDKEAAECFDEEQYLYYYLGYDHLHFYQHKATFLTVTGDFQEAILYYNKALDLIPTDIIIPYDVDKFDIMSCKAYALHQLGELEDAQYYFDLVERLAKEENFNISDVYFYYCKGNLLQDIGKKEAAFKYYNIAESKGLCTGEFYKTMGNLLKYFHEEEAALLYYNKAKNIGLEFGEFYQIQGDILLHDVCSNKERVLEYYNKAESLGLKTSGLYRKKGDLLWFFNRQKEALKYYNKALDLNPKNKIALKHKLQLAEEIELVKEPEQLEKCSVAIHNYKEKKLDELFKPIEYLYNEEREYDLFADEIQVSGVIENKEEAAI
jgi:tetratricopeptide (TPR) repeat protein